MYLIALLKPRPVKHSNFLNFKPRRFLFDGSTFVLNGFWFPTSHYKYHFVDETKIGSGGIGSTKRYNLS